MADRDKMKEGNGILFYEDESDNKNAPDMTGRIFLDCPECKRATMQRLAGWWHRKGKNEYLKVTHSEPMSKKDKDDDRDSGRRGGSRRGSDRGSNRDDDRRGSRRDDDDRRERGRDRDEDRPRDREEERPREEDSRRDW